EVALLEVGQLRLSGQGASERIFEARVTGPSGRAPVRPRLARRREALPPEPTPLIGRERELFEVHALLGDPTTRLVSLARPGGIGKTRLARRLAVERTSQLSSSVIFVSLEPLSDPALVPSTISQALGLTETGERSTLETLRNALAERAILLVLDNFEQILPAA